MKNEHNGFTLVEMAMVLVVIGLLIGGIIAGQSMIAAAKMRSQITQLQQYKTAVKLFDELYKGIPGDITNGVALFGATTANGDGDGLLEAATAYGTPTSYITADSSSYDGERPHFFMQLKLANLIEQTFDGSSNVDAGYPSLKLNKSAGAFVSGAWGVSTGNNQYSDIELIATANLYFASFNNIAAFGTISGTSHNDGGGALTPQEMFEIEKKIDDSTPASGKILAQALAPSVPCCDATTYNLAGGSNRVCNMLYDLTD